MIKNRVQQSGIWLVAIGMFLLSGCATTQKNTNYLALSQKAESAYNKGNYTLAESLYKKLAQGVPTLALPWFRLGNIYANTGRPKDAVSAYNEALIRDNNLAKAWYNMGVVYARQSAAAFIQASRSKSKETGLQDISAQRANAILDVLAGKKAKHPGISPAGEQVSGMHTVDAAKIAKPGVDTEP